MKTLIFGATGSIGKYLVEQALEQGHFVRAFVRDTNKLEKKHPRIEVVQGDVLNYASVEKAVQDQDAVICVLGAGRKGQIRSVGTKNIVRAMEVLNVKRLVCQTSLGLGESRGNLNFFWKHIMFGFLLKEAFADHQLQEEYVSKSNLDWTIVRPAAFTDGALTGKYKHGFSPMEKRLSLKISRPDVADFLLKQLHDKDYVRKMPGLSY